MNNERQVIDEIVPVLKSYLDISNRDREITQGIIKDLKEAAKEANKCAVNMKVQIGELKTHSKMFAQTCKGQRDTCVKKHDAFEKKLAEIPSEKLMAVRDKKLEGLETAMSSLSKEVRGLIIKVYVMVGVAGSTIALIKWGLPFVLSTMKTANGGG